MPMSIKSKVNKCVKLEDGGKLAGLIKMIKLEPGYKEYWSNEHGSRILYRTPKPHRSLSLLVLSCRDSTNWA